MLCRNRSVIERNRLVRRSVDPCAIAASISLSRDGYAVMAACYATLNSGRTNLRKLRKDILKLFGRAGPQEGGHGAHVEARSRRCLFYETNPIRVLCMQRSSSHVVVRSPALACAG